jgi:hypothetical protein
MSRFPRRDAPIDLCTLSGRIDLEEQRPALRMFSVVGSLPSTSHLPKGRRLQHCHLKSA